MKQVLMMVFALATGMVAAQDRIAGLPIKLGDSMASVKTALATAIEPEDFKSAQGDTKMLRLKARGIWVFFDRQGRVRTIRLDAPFAGSVGGVQIGQSRALLVEKLGKPAKITQAMPSGPSPERPERYLYDLDDRTTARFDLDRGGRVQTIFLVK